MATFFSSTGRQKHNEIGNVFHDIVAQSSYGYASSSSTESKMPCDVFINHRGTDVKDTVAKAIYDSLTRIEGMEVHVFFDKEVLEPGVLFPKEIQEAMDSASLHIAIFSQNYGESRWCLEELCYMLKTGTKIIPIFFHVEISDLRYLEEGKGIYVDAFRKHPHKYNQKKVREWISALRNVSFISGYQITNDDYHWVLEGLKDCVAKVMRKQQLAGPTHPVGVEEKVADFESNIIKSCSLEIAGIVGMGGCGKTTLAQEIYNRKCSSIRKSAFLYDVRTEARENQLPIMQKKLLDNLQVKCSPFENVREGIDILADRLRYHSVLIVLDDVDHKDQLDALIPTKERLGSGSLIIVTTRDLDVLTSFGISNRSIYRMGGLSRSHSRQLFCLNAFQKANPLHGFEDLVEKVLDICQGLPLSLKVLGGQFCYKPRDYWESQLDEFSRVLPEGISSRLKISYDALGPEEQELFLDIACFFIGEIKNLAIEVWDGLGRNGVYGWEMLKSKCLVELDKNNRIRMHDHLRDLGRQVANKESPYRIWFKNRFNNISTQAKEQMQIRGIMAATTWSYFIPDFNRRFVRCGSHYPLPFEEWVELMGSSSSRDAFSVKYLVFRNRHFNAKIGELSKGLVWLRWFDLNAANLLSCFSLGNLRVLELYEVKCSETFLKNNEKLPLQLRELVIHSSDGANFQRFPSWMGRLKHLKKIVIYFGGPSVSSLPEQFCNLQFLEHLELFWFRKLSSLPTKLGNLKRLRHLDLGSCITMRKLPVSFKQLTNLQYLDLSNCKELSFNSQNLDILEYMTKLEHVSLSSCSKLEALPHHITNQPSLRKLCFDGTCVRTVPTNIGELKKLEELSIGSDLLTSLPTSLADLYSLRKLEITGCKNLKSLPDSVGRLSALEDLVIKVSGVKCLPETFGRLANLQKLYISNCPLSGLAFQSGSAALLSKLRKIDLRVTHILTISISEDCCPSLEVLKLLDNRFLRKIETMPKTVKQLKLRSPTRVGELSSFAHLTSLTEIDIKVCRKVKNLKGLEQLRSLETLRVHSQWKVPGITSLKHMKRLKTVELVADSIAAIAPCIQSIEKWPCEIKICARAVGAESIVNSLPFENESTVNPFPFENLSVVDSFAQDDPWMLTCPEMRLSHAAMVCLVMDAPSECCELSIRDRKRHTVLVSGLMLRKGKWVWISVCDSSNMAKEYYIDQNYGTQSKKPMCSMIIEKGLLLVGEEENLRKAFKELLLL